MSVVIAAIVRAARRRPRVVVGVLAVVLAVSGVGLSRLSFDTNVLSLLPREGRVVDAFRTFVGRFGGLDQLYVVFTAPEGRAVGDYREDVEAWVEALREAPEIARVDAGVIDDTRDLAWLGARQLLLLPDAVLETAMARFTPDGMRAAVAARRELLAVPSPELAALVRQDPLGLFDLLRNAMGPSGAGMQFGPGRDGYVTADGRARLVTARPRRPPYDSTFSQALDARLTAIAAARLQAAPTGSPDPDPLAPLRVEFAGGHRIAVETEAVVKRESLFNSIGSLALILPLLFAVFRSLWLVGVGSLPSVLSLVVVLGGLGFFGVRLSAASTGAAAMLFGLGIDGVVLLYVAHQLAQARGEGTGTAAIEGPSVSMVLGMFTTAATFYGLAFVDFPSLRDLGLLIGHSMVVCGVLTLVMVPAFLPRRPPRRTSGTLVLPRLAEAIVARRRGILVGAAILTLGLGWAATRLRVDPTLDRLRSTTPAADLETRIGSAFGLPGEVYVVLAHGGDLQMLLRTNERLTDQLQADVPGLAVEAPTRLVPSDAAQDARAARIQQARLSVATIRASLDQARAAAGFTAGAFDPFLLRLPGLIDPTARVSYDGYVAHGLGDLAGRFIAREGTQWWLATYVFPTSPEQAAAVGAAVAAVDPTQTLTGLPLVNADLARRFLPDFLKGLAIGSIVVVLLVAATFRGLRLSVLALLPTVVGLVWTAGLLAIAGVVLDLFAIFAVVTFIGIGVDYGVHLVHRYHEHGDATRATAELAPVVLVAAAITFLGYATLMTSSYPPLRSIGLVSTVSVVALAVASLLVLPALLARPGDR